METFGEAIPTVRLHATEGMLTIGMSKNVMHDRMRKLLGFVKLLEFTKKCCDCNTNSGIIAICS